MAFLSWLKNKPSHFRSLYFALNYLNCSYKAITETENNNSSKMKLNQIAISIQRSSWFGIVSAMMLVDLSELFSKKKKFRDVYKFWTIFVETTLAHKDISFTYQTKKNSTFSWNEIKRTEVVKKRPYFEITYYRVE